MKSSSDNRDKHYKGREWKSTLKNEVGRYSIGNERMATERATESDEEYSDG